MAKAKDEMNSETLQATSLPSASLPIPSLLSLLSTLLPLSPPLSPNLILRDGLANSRLLVGCKTPPPLLAAPAASITRLFHLPVCVVHIHTHIHTRCPTYSFAARFLAHISHSHLPNLILLFDLLLLFSSLSCLSTHAHNVARILCRACVTITCICMCFFFSYIYIHALIPHVVGFSPAHLFLHTSAFSYIFTFVFSLRAFWHVNTCKHTRACTSVCCVHTLAHANCGIHAYTHACPHVSAMLAHVCTCAV